MFLLFVRDEWGILLLRLEIIDLLDLFNGDSEIVFLIMSIHLLSCWFLIK